jgi:hypothetical protein
MSTVSILNTDSQISAKTLTILNSANSGNLIFVDATYDIGAAGATRPRDFYLSRNAVVGNNLNVIGVSTLSDDIVLTADKSIRRDTVDGADTGTVFITGGGAYGGTGTRGASITLSGNEETPAGNVGPGLLGLQIGDVATSSLTVFYGPSANAALKIDGSSGATALQSGAATPAGGSTAVRLTFGSGAIGIYAGSGVPTVSAAKGSLYLRSDGSSTSTRAYINTDGGTTWTAITTAA